MLVELQAGDRMILLASLIQCLSDLVPHELEDERDHLNQQIATIFEQCISIE